MDDVESPFAVMEVPRGPGVRLICWLCGWAHVFRDTPVPYSSLGRESFRHWMDKHASSEVRR